jgi:threonine/homoserine/homoserine lactone efflux protein
MIVPFIAISLLATATPGPSVLYVISAGVSSGARGAGPGMLGVLCADALYFALSAAGLGTFLLASYTIFSIVKFAGAVYLVYLGCRLLRLAFVGGKSARVDVAKTPTQTRWFSGGFMLHAANPKALLFFVSILPQFLVPGDPITPQIAVLGCLHMIIAASVLCGYGLFAGTVRVFADRPWFARTMYASSGSMLVAAGVSLALIRRAR